MQNRVLVLRPHAATIGGVEHYYNVLALEQFDPRFEYFHVTEPNRGSASAVVARLLRLYIRFWRALGSGRYGLIVVNPSLNRNSFYRDALFLILARLRGGSVTIFLRGWSDEMERRIEQNWLPRFVFRASFGRGSRFILLGETFRSRLLRLGCNPQASYAMASTVADDSYLAGPDLPRRLGRSSLVRLLFISRLVPAKGALIALRAFELAQARLPDVTLQLTIAGDGPEMRVLRTYIAAHAVSGVQLVGTVTGDAKRELLLDSDILVFPTSHGEGMPNVVLEAMLYGMPVLSRRIGGIPDVVEHGVNGFLTMERDPAVFADWIVTLATDHELRRRMSIANHRRALANFTRDRVRARFIELVDASMLA